jgi:hypothetical protein
VFTKESGLVRLPPLAFLGAFPTGRRGAGRSTWYAFGRPGAFCVASRPALVNSSIAASTVCRLSPACRAIVRMLGNAHPVPKSE